MKLQTIMNQALALLVTATILTGCEGLALLSKDKSFSGRDSMVLDAPRTDILDVIAAVGKSMKYDVSDLDKDSGQITLSSGISAIEFIGIGKASQSSLEITTQDGGKKLDINVMVDGNYGTGGQDAANKLVAVFKTKLRERLGIK